MKAQMRLKGFIMTKKILSVSNTFYFKYVLSLYVVRIDLMPRIMRMRICRRGDYSENERMYTIIPRVERDVLVKY
jgi:hypothetical protein